MIPPLILPYSKTWLCLRKLNARLLPPPERPSAPVLLPPLLFFLLSLFYLHQLLKALGCCRIDNKPILQRQNTNTHPVKIQCSRKRYGRLFFLGRIRAEHSKEETDMKLELRTVSYKLEKFGTKQSLQALLV